MVDWWIDWASGPLLRLALLVMALGLARVFVLQIVELAIARGRAGDPSAQWRLVARRTLAWVLLWRALRRRDRIAYNTASIVFHAGVIVVPVFLWGHVALWRPAVGLPLPALPPQVADVLTLVTAAALAWLLVWRMAAPAMRVLSGAQDWIAPLLCLGVFLSGFASAHPAWSPIGARSIYLAHLLLGNALLLAVPFSKLQHIVLFWTTQASTELGWRFTPGAGERVRVTLGKQGQGI
jgi:nitrate reductase gamma subunit